MKDSSNQNIKCSVKTCKHHNSDNYCALQDINVGTNCTDTKSKYETECMSFECGCNNE